jgi:hypothetical protein
MLAHRWFSRCSSYTSQDEDAAIYNLYGQAKGSFNNAAQAATENSLDREKMLHLQERVGFHMDYLTWIETLKLGDPPVTQDQLAEWIGQLSKFYLWQEASELCRRWLKGATDVVPVVVTQDGGEDGDARHLYELLQQIVAVSSMLHSPLYTYSGSMHTHTDCAHGAHTPNLSPNSTRRWRKRKTWRRRKRLTAIDRNA